MHPKRLNPTLFFIVFRGCIVRANRLAVRKGNPSFLLARCQEALAYWTVKSYSLERRVVLASEHARSMDIHGLYLFLPFFFSRRSTRFTRGARRVFWGGSRGVRREYLATLVELFLAAYDELLLAALDEFFWVVLAAFDESTSRRSTSFFSRLTIGFSRDARRAVCLSFFFSRRTTGLTRDACRATRSFFLSCLPRRTTRLTCDAC